MLMLNLRVVGQLHRTWSRKWSCCCNPRLGDGSHYSHSFSHPRYQRRHPSFHRICTFSRMSTTEVTEISSNMSLSSMLSAAQSRFVTEVFGESGLPRTPNEPFYFTYISSPHLQSLHVPTRTSALLRHFQIHLPGRRVSACIADNSLCNDSL